MKKLMAVLTALFVSFLFFGCQSLPKQAETKKSPNKVSYGKDSFRSNASTSTYKIIGTCNGLPRINVKTAPGFCLGLVDNGIGLIKPRYALQLDATHILLTDMGGWKPQNGQIYLLTFENKKWVRKSIINSTNLTEEKKCILNQTHQLVRNSLNEIFVTSSDCVATINPFEVNPNHAIQIKISQLPNTGLHPLKAIGFDPSANIYMNVGSITDNCELETSEVCHELTDNGGRGVIRKYLRNSDGSYDSQFSIFARGQRNSMALTWNEKTNSLWTAENARDYIERKDSQLNGQEKPSDEMNIVQENAELDWPYCYDDSKVSPEFPKADCQKFQKPHLLFPAHSAPLSYLLYTGSLFPSWYKNRLLVSFHGYAAYGHRIVTYKRNDNLEPVGAPLSVVYGWEAAANGQLVGSPVGITQGLDGSVFIVEDTSQKVLQLYYNAKEGNGSPVAELILGTAKVDQTKLAQDFQKAEDKRKIAFTEKLRKPAVPLFTQIQNKIIDQNCTLCHGGLSYPGVQLLKYDDIGNYKKLKDQLLPRLKGDGAPQMPPGGLPADQQHELFDLVNQWVQAGSPAP